MRRTRRAVLRGVATTAVVSGLAGCSESPESGMGTTAEGTTAGGTTSDAVGGTTSAGSDGTTTAGESTTESSTGTTDDAAAGTTAGGEADNTVGMYTELYFDPVGLHVQPGETVAFELVSGAHSATAYHPDNTAALSRRIPDGAPAWDTGVFGDVGTTRTVTFETEGTHDYYCIPHKGLGMVGRIVVGAPGGPAEEGPNPDARLPPSARIVEEESVSWEEWRQSLTGTTASLLR